MTAQNDIKSSHKTVRCLTDSVIQDIVDFKLVDLKNTTSVQNGLLCLASPASISRGTYG